MVEKTPKTKVEKNTDGTVVVNDTNYVSSGLLDEPVPGGRVSKKKKNKRVTLGEGLSPNTNLPKSFDW